MEEITVNLIKMLILFGVLYKITDYLLKKTIKEQHHKNDELSITLRKTADYKLRLAKIAFMIGFVFIFLLLIYKLYSTYF